MNAMPSISEPLRDLIGRAIYEEPGRGLNWYLLSEERREPWRRDADRVLNALKSDLSSLSCLKEQIEGLISGVDVNLSEPIEGPVNL